MHHTPYPVAFILTLILGGFVLGFAMMEGLRMAWKSRKYNRLYKGHRIK